jgi:hypothetical protein
MPSKFANFSKNMRIVMITLGLVYAFLFVLAVVNHEHLTAMNYIGFAFLVLYLIFNNSKTGPPNPDGT